MDIFADVADRRPETSGSVASLQHGGSELKPPRRRIVLRLVVLAGTIGVYGAYRHLRVTAGRGVLSQGLPVEAFRHAVSVLDVEHALGLDVERGLQQSVIDHRFVIEFANAYYSWAHQAMTFAFVAVVVLRAPWSTMRRWVGAVLLQLPVALVLFSVYPLMPPRLLDAGAPWGGRILGIHRELHPTGIVDTLVTVRGPWSPGPIALDAFTNQFAAMPSLHCGFAMWVGVVWWRWAKGRSWRFVGPLHTMMMAFFVVVTGNHYVLDVVVGWSIALFTLGLSARFAGIRGWLHALGRAYAPGVQGDSSRMPSTTSISQ